ncbi:uncharacterized protein LOC144753966 [Lissotriton helveticus]
MLSTVLMLLSCGLATSVAQDPERIVYSSLGESLLLPCEWKPPQIDPLSDSPNIASPANDRPPTQWHFLAPSGEMHPLAAWLSGGRIYRASGTRQTRVEMLDNATLRVQALRLGDAGRYICFESDVVGNSTFVQNITLIITGPDIEGTSYGVHASLGALLGAKVLMLILIVSFCVVKGMKKGSSNYANVTE